MRAFILDEQARGVLARYPKGLRDGDLIALGNHHGFSGARIWKLQGQLGALCLRAWPPRDPSIERLHFLHHLMSLARASGLDCVPALFATEAGSTWVEHAGRLWELTTWMPGRAKSRLRAACTVLARLHRTWAEIKPSIGPCPAIGRRLARIHDWQQQITNGWRPAFENRSADPLARWAVRAWHLLGERVGRVPSILAPWQDRLLPLQPCLCDIWHEHVLYEGDRVTGLIDFGGTKIDHPSVDLARLLGSFVGDDAEGWAVGLEAYRIVRQFSSDEEAFARILDQTGVIVGAMTWLRWLYLEKRDIEDRCAAAERLGALVRRMET